MLDRNHKTSFNEVVGAIFFLVSLIAVLVFSLNDNGGLLTTIGLK